jgi:membrane protein implicated in regulation of membrane protease activity
MYLVLIAWIYVAFMMAIAEATSPVGSLLGAAFTFLLYGVLPMSVVGYIMGSPARRRAIKAKEAAERASATPDAHREASSDPVAPVRKEP